MDLAERIISRMNALELTQEQVALRSGISQGMVGKLVNRKAKKTAEIVGLAGALQCSIEWLATGNNLSITDQPHNNETPIQAKIREKVQQLGKTDQAMVLNYANFLLSLSEKKPSSSTRGKRKA